MPVIQPVVYSSQGVGESEPFFQLYLYQMIQQLSALHRSKYTFVNSLTKALSPEKALIAVCHCSFKSPLIFEYVCSTAVLAISSALMSLTTVNFANPSNDPMKSLADFIASGDKTLTGIMDTSTFVILGGAFGSHRSLQQAGFNPRKSHLFI